MKCGSRVALLQTCVSPGDQLTLEASAPSQTAVVASAGGACASLLDLLFFCWAMHRSFLRLFPNVPPPCRGWLDFDFFDGAFYPPEPDPQEHVAYLSVNKLKTSCFYRQAPPLSYWYIFANDSKNRFAEDRTPWYIHHIPQRVFFEIDHVYCGGESIMMKIAEPEWPRWMVIWVQHSSMMQHSRYGRLFRRPKYSAWRASHRAA